MNTYDEYEHKYNLYLDHAKSKGFQPMGKPAFYALIQAGFNPITSTWT